MSLGLYIHIPFCIRKCNYCDFASGPPRRQGEIGEYLEALEQEIAIACSLLAPAGCSATPKLKQLDTIYLGGGTPTILTAEQLIRVLEKCRDFFYWTEEAEVTIEANPGTVDYDKLVKFRAAGINRISFGVQSFDDDLLQAMGRIHTNFQAKESIGLAKLAGFKNISLDLIFGLPGQSIDLWEKTLDEAVALGVQHLSLYGLQIEEGTHWGEKEASGLIELPEEEIVLEMRDLADLKLAAFGYSRYEISNYGLPGYESCHNLCYWHNQEYLGIGLGASSHLWGRRITNTVDLALYIKLLASGQLPVAEEELLTDKQRMGETIFLALRLREGVDCQAFFKRFGVRLEQEYKQELAELINLGMVEKNDSQVYLTAKGRRLANRVFAYFV